MSILTQPRSPGPKLLLTAKQAAEALGVCPRLLWQLTAPRGPLSAIRLPGRGKARALRYDVRDLLGWIDATKAQTATPPAATDGAV